MSWRPEGFYNNLAMMPTGGENNTVEFVADTMLEALKKQGEARTRQGIRGYWVFIPDEES